MLIGGVLIVLGLIFAFASFFAGVYFAAGKTKELTCLGMLGMIVGGAVAFSGLVLLILSAFQQIQYSL